MLGVLARDDVWMQGSCRLDREFLDARALCGHLVGVGSVHAFLAEHRSRLFPDGMFADLFGSGRGRPCVPGEVIAVVMVLQALEGLSDREACRRLRTDIAWKAAAGLALTDEAFHPTVLTLWRNKLRASERPERVFDAVRELIADTGAVAGKRRRVLDSTVLDDAVARQDTVTMLVNQIRRVRKLSEGLADVWVRERNLEPAGAVVDWGDPGDVERLVSELVDDALELIGTAQDLDLGDAASDAVALLALVAGQDVEPGDGPGRWRIARRTAPGRVISTVDPESRHVHKSRSVYRDDYKAHIAAEPDTGLITAVELTAGDVSDAGAAPALIADEPAGTEVYGDSAYGTAELRAHLAEREMGAVIKPPPIQTAVPGGYSVDDIDIDIDLDTGTVTCPDRITVAISPNRTARFARNCRSCPVRARCTTAKAGRTIKIHPRHELLNPAREQARTDLLALRVLGWSEGVEECRVGFAGVEECSDSVVLEVGEPERCAFDELGEIVRCLGGSVGDARAVPVRDLGPPASQGAAESVHLRGPGGVAQIAGEGVDGSLCEAVAGDLVGLAEGLFGVPGVSHLAAGIAGCEQASQLRVAVGAEAFVGHGGQLGDPVQRVVVGAPTAERVVVDAAAHLVDHLVGEAHDPERVRDLACVPQRGVERLAVRT